MVVGLVPDLAAQLRGGGAGWAASRPPCMRAAVLGACEPGSWVQKA